MGFLHYFAPRSGSSAHERLEESGRGMALLSASGLSQLTRCPTMRHWHPSDVIFSALISLLAVAVALAAVELFRYLE